MPGEWLQFKSIQLSSDDQLSADFEAENLQFGRTVETLDLSISSFWDRAYRRVSLSREGNSQKPTRTRENPQTNFKNPPKISKTSVRG